MADQDRYQIKMAQQTDNGIHIQWNDGHVSHFHSIWLRHQCECASCGTPLNAVRALRLHDIPEDLGISELEYQQDQIEIDWTPVQHHSVYQARWLRNHCYSDSERQSRKHQPTLWDSSIETSPPVFDFNEIEANDEKRLDMLQTVCDFGFCKTINLPAKSEESHRMINLIGTQRQTHFGHYKLSRKASINNVGDIRHELPPHSDETYRTSTIGITIFQVLNPAVTGGASTLVDGFEAARRFRSKFPQEFDLLTATPVFAQRFDPDHAEHELPRLYQCRLPIIKLDSDGDVAAVRINERQIAPPDLPVDQIEPFYSALRKLMQIVYDPELLITFPLQRGEGLVFNNQRVLHGRTAFESGDSKRSVLTSSVDLDDFYSSLRILMQTLKPEQQPITYSRGLVV